MGRRATIPARDGAQVSAYAAGMGFSIEPLLQALNVAGLAVFAASGALAAARKRLDFVGDRKSVV